MRRIRSRGHALGGRVLAGGWATSWLFAPLTAGGGHPTPPPPARDESVIWHDLECGAYAADLELWRELGSEAPGPVLDLGCGTGRVALDLGKQGYEVVGLDEHAGLVDELRRRAKGVSVEALVGDAREFGLGREFGLVLAPMQLVQLFRGGRERVECLGCVRRHLAKGGLAAFAVVESLPEPVDLPPPVPDTREVEGWVYSSQPVDLDIEAGGIRIRRLRQTVAPDGGLEEELDEVVLRPLKAATLEREAAAAGLRPAGRLQIPATDEHVGSTVVVLEGHG